MKTSPLYRLEVAPLAILPLTRSPFFSYASDHIIPKGSLVSISFGKQTLEGVVYACDPLPGTRPIWMKYVSHIITPQFLTETQCELALRVSEEYFTPLGRTLKHFLPKRVTARMPAKKQKESDTKRKVLRPTAEEERILTALNKNKTAPSFLDSSALADLKRMIAIIVKAESKAKKQTLIIVPEILLALGYEAAFKTYFKDSSVAILHSKLSDSAYYASWERIRSGKANIIIATRQGLFAPFRDLGIVIVTEEQDESYKQWDMSPRYHGKRVAAMLSSLMTTKLLSVSGTPSLETLREIKDDRTAPLIPLVKHGDILPSLTIVNLKLERYRRNFSPLSEALVLALRDLLDRGEQALLYINRQGMNAFSVCESCKNVFRCPHCDHPLTGTKDGFFRCVSCGHATTLFPNCPSCGHLSFRHVGFGTERIEKEIRKLFPRARVARLDSTTMRTPTTLQKTIADGKEGAIDILIGTQMILKDPPLPKLSLIAMIDADSMLLFPDFQADERLFRDLSRAVRQVGKQPRGAVFVQTFRPDGAFFQKIAGKDSLKVLETMLSEREELSYPPFSRFLSLTCQGRTEKEVNKKTKVLLKVLEEEIPRGYKLSSPRPVTFLKKKTLFETVLLIRFPAHQELAPEFVTLLRKNSKECIIDIDPISPR